MKTYFKIYDRQQCQQQKGRRVNLLCLLPLPKCQCLLSHRTTRTCILTWKKETELVLCTKGKYLFEQSSCSTEWSTESRADRQTDKTGNQASLLLWSSCVEPETKYHNKYRNAASHIQPLDSSKMPGDWSYDVRDWHKFWLISGSYYSCY